MKIFNTVLILVAFFWVGAANEELNVLITTWNVNERNPPQSLAKLLGQEHSKGEQSPDIIIIGLQDIVLGKYSFGNDVPSDLWSTTIKKELIKKKYVLVRTVSLVGMLLKVYVRSIYEWEIQESNIHNVMTALQGMFGNKGAVFLKFTLYDKTFCIVNARFHSHDNDVFQRVKDYQTIEAERLDFCYNPSDYIFWLGDLNFRLEKRNLPTDKILNMVKAGNYSGLLQRDELSIRLKNGAVFKGFKESAIKFRPSYPLLAGTGEYDVSKRPSWSARVLYKSDTHQQITPLFYRSVDSYTVSEHLPVQQAFRIYLDDASQSNDIGPFML